MNYYYLKEGETLGPLPIDDLVKIIDGNTLVWNEDGSMKDWLPAKDVSDIYSFIGFKRVENIIEKPSDKTREQYDLSLPPYKKKEPEIIKSVNVGSKNRFKHSGYFLLTVVIMLPGLAYWIYLLNNFYEISVKWFTSNGFDKYGSDKNNVFHSLPWYITPVLNWIIYVLTPLLIGIVIWNVNFRKYSRIQKPPENFNKI